jgi:immune inhibitor A
MSPVVQMGARSRARLFMPFMVAVLIATAMGVTGAGTRFETARAAGPYTASAFEFREPPAVPCIEPTINGFESTFYGQGDCLRMRFALSNTPTADNKVANVELIGPAGGTPYATVPAVQEGDNDWMILTTVDTSWPAGRSIARVKVVGESASSGEAPFFVNQLGAVVNPVAPLDGVYTPGEQVDIEGNIAELNDVGGNTQKTGVPASFKVRVLNPAGTVLHTSGVLTADGTLGSEGDFSYSIPAGVTSGITAGPESGYKAQLGIQIIEATYTDPLLGEWAGNPAGAGSVTIQTPPASLLIDAIYGSPTGWVKPNDEYPFHISLSNYTTSAATSIVVTVTAPPSTDFLSANTLGSGSALVTANSITWTIPTLAAAAGPVPTTATMVVEAQADSLAEDPEIVWKDLSTTATLSYSGGPGGLQATTHGPKVIPPAGDFETARYGDKPFVMVPVDFTDRKHDAVHTGDALSNKVNSAAVEGSTFNLYQEMSFGQLYPHGTVPSVGVGSADFTYTPGFEFSQRDVTKPTCRGTTFGDLPQPLEEQIYGSPAYPERIHDGWYQLPGDTEYYGGDFPAFTLGTGSTIDGACGNTSKSVYDAAVIADPEIDYNDYDLDKDGVVDFFMMVFTGIGGNGASQTSVPPYDNIWPHSSSLEYSYTQPGTGLKGYVSDDQLKNLEGIPQCWLTNAYQQSDDCSDAGTGGSGDPFLPVFVRVGPYNVNPETAIDQSSVIAHEYGHHLGVPDFYSTSYTTYNDWNLMATDYSQHMTTFIKQEYGWVVPDFLQPGDSVSVDDWQEIKNDTGEIHWETPAGTPYTLSSGNGDQNVHNGEVYGLKLPRGFIIDEDLVRDEASFPNVWYSGRGNDFGCTPIGGHNLDIPLPELASVAEGTTVTLDYKSAWDMEWDFDYGFTMVTTDGANYTALPSQNTPPTTTPNTINPNNAGCEQQYNNGITGSSGSYDAGSPTFAVDRNPGAPIYQPLTFIDDQYDLSAYAGMENVVLRFSYYTDPGLDRLGWFIDDLKVTADTDVIYSSDFTTFDPLHQVPGGCGDNGIKTAELCTAGWSLIDASAGAQKDHGYYLELRDRSGFDYDGHGQADRGAIEWSPGVLIEYTDEARGYGNNAGPPPRQHYIDSQPDPGLDCGEALTDDPLTTRDDTAKQCDDAAFTAAVGDSHFDDNPTGGAEPGDWVDNFADDTSSDGFWHFAFNCLSLDVTAMSGADPNEALPSNLSADATITALPGCAEFSYTGEYPNLPPIAKANVKPSSGGVNTNFTFDGSGSVDDNTPSGDLTYEWDFDTDGTYDATGQVVVQSFSTPGLKTVTLRVTDDDASPLSSTDTVKLAVVGCTAPPFPDVPISHPFCGEITWMKDSNIATGYGDGTYKPSNPVLRQAMAAFLARAADATLDPCLTPPFPDVPTTHPFCEEIQWIRDRGISTGFGDGTYRPQTVVTRQAMAAFMARLANATLTDCTTQPFSDIATSHPFCREIQWMKTTGISTGFGDGTYRPSQAVSRQAMAAFILRLSVLLP